MTRLNPHRSGPDFEKLRDLVESGEIADCDHGTVEELHRFLGVLLEQNLGHLRFLNRRGDELVLCVDATGEPFKYNPSAEWCVRACNPENEDNW